jgi:uncharacterized protein (TIGR03435 family)
MIKRLLLLLFLASSVGAGCGFAQSSVAGEPLPAFEVASVKPGDPDARGSQLMMGLDRMSSKNMPLKMLILVAYGLKSDDQLLGLPDSLGSKGFDIEAKQAEAQAAEIKKLPADQRNTQVRLMLQSLLEERFKLKLSRQTKELPIYALVVAKSGVKMTPAVVSPVAPEPETADGPEKPKVKPGRMIMFGRGEVTGEAVSISVLADLLSRQPETGGRVVVDKTGLTGSYKMALKWTPESAAPMMGGGGGGDAAPPESTAPSFFTAIQEQLGLKLESQKGPVEVLVVEHVEEPSAN